MPKASVQNERRRGNRAQVVLPVRVRGLDASGESFEELAHTLDLAPNGTRLGAIRRTLRALDTVTVIYHQRRFDFSVVWTRQLKGTNEFQVGLKAFSQEAEAWASRLFNSGARPVTKASATSGGI